MGGEGAELKKQPGFPTGWMWFGFLRNEMAGGTSHFSQGIVCGGWVF